MPNYQNSKIYKLVSPHTDEIYIGSTTQKLCERMSGHRRDYRRFKNGKDRKHCDSLKLFELSENDMEVKMILIKEFPCENKEQLIKEEYKLINESKTLNSNRGQWLNNQENYFKDYQKKNKDWISQKRKKFREENKEKISTEKKIQYEKNKEIILEKMKEKETCDCGSTFRKCSKARHEKTIKHQNYLLQN